MTVKEDRNKILREIEETIRTTGYRYILEAIYEMLKREDIKYHQATRDNFEYLKGRFNMLNEVYGLLKNPKILYQQPINKLGGGINE